mmetsp:Transcript_4134/g.10566  ORF Transcript_4134/g.10566 Transcript_4134/m.10566 type:complete len:241 (-) Transcript_4134:90-812(-)
MFCKPVSTLAVAALLLAGAANAWEPWGGARSVSILRIGAISSTQEDNPVGDYDAAAVAKRPGFQGNEAAVQTFADPGYEATADVAGETEAVAASEDSFSLGLVRVRGDAFTGSDGSTEANTLLEAGSIAAQVDEGTAAGGSFGGVEADATGTTDVDPDFGGGDGDASAISDIPLVAVSEAGPGFSGTYLLQEFFGDIYPFTEAITREDDAEATAELGLTQLACSDLNEEDCNRGLFDFGP